MLGGIEPDNLLLDRSSERQLLFGSQVGTEPEILAFDILRSKRFF